MTVSARWVLLVFALLGVEASRAEGDVPAWLIRLPESVSSVFIAEAATSQFHHYEQSNGELELAASYYMSVGKNGWGKERAGDMRSPVGAYLVTEQLDTERMHEKYGITAYVLDYPNAWDLRLSRTGDGIWVHGVDRNGGRRPPRDTDGCIALPNDNLAELSGRFEDGQTPVLIAEAIEYTTTGARLSLARELESAVEAWAQSVADGDLHTYLSYYDDDFERWGMDRGEWASFSVQTLGQRPINAVAISDLLLLGYPGEEGLYLSRFRQTLTEGETVKESVQRLYWRRDERGALKIVAEDSG
jgi:murein L,D-transpeptidase YafK